MSDMRFEDVPQQVATLCENVRLKHFVALDGARVMYVFDTKKTVKGGRIVMARIKKLSDEMKYLAMTEHGTTYDYVMTFDKLIWDALDEVDQQRIIYHEFCHCEVDFEKATPFGIKDHEIQGFYDEAVFNADDYRWSERISVIADSVYDPENEPTPPTADEPQD